MEMWILYLGAKGYNLEKGKGQLSNIACNIKLNSTYLFHFNIL